MRRAPEEMASGGEADDRVDAGWGPALAPAGFGTFLNDLPAGNFRDQRLWPSGRSVPGPPA